MRTPAHSKEVFQLIGLIKASLAAETTSGPQAARLLLEKPDWQALLQTAGHHGLTPLLIQTLLPLSDNLVPDKIRQTLRQKLASLAIVNLRLTGALFEVYGRLSQAGITAIPYKGPLLSEIEFHSPTGRIYDDLDILVGEGDIPRAQAVLCELGYRREQEQNSFFLKKYIRTECEFSFVHPETGICIELHWRLVPAYWQVGLDIGGLQNSTYAARIQNTLLPHFTPEALFLVLALHGAKHGWRFLCLFSDLAQIPAAHPEFDWDNALILASRFKIKKFLLLGAALIHQRLGVQIPEDLKVKAERDRGVAKAIAHCLPNALSSQPAYEPIAWEVKFQLLLKESSPDKARFIRDFIFAPNIYDWDWIRLPAWIYPMYYLLRPLRLLIKYARNASG